MKKKGFTLIELLVAIVIIALLSGLGVVSYRSIFTTAEEKYYNAIESNLLLAGNDYFEDHRDELPVGSEYSSVSLVDLIENKYLEEVVDTDGNLCSDGMVYAYRDNNKFKYEACLECGSHKSNGKYCSGPAQRKITVVAKKVLSNEDYPDIEKSYNKAGYSNGENIIATFSMNSEYSVKQYKVFNTRTDDEPLTCSVSSGTSCSVELEKSGTYRVIVYDEENLEISSKYINVKIAKGQANFTLGGDDKYLITKNECSKNKTTKKLTININKQISEDYESVKYQIYTDPNNRGEFKEPRGLRIEEELESGHYTIDVIVKNYSDEEEKMVSKTFDISYLIDVTYEDGDTPITHEVVKGQTYNYLNSLPETKQSYGQNLEIRWFKGETQFNPGETLVSNDCTFTIVGKTAIPVNVENFATYCNKDAGVNGLKYTGSELTLTNTPPANVTFTNNKGTAVNTYSVKAHIQAPLYIWNDGTTADKTFNCSIVKGDNPMTVTDNQTWNVSYSPNNQTKTITGAANAAGSITYSITSQPSGNKFSLSGTTLTMAGGTSTGTHTVVITAHAAGNGSYNPIDIPFTITISVGVVPNRMTVTTPQTWTPTFATAAQEKTFTGASSADGAVTYSIPSDKNNATIRGYFTIPTAGTAKVKMKENTPPGEYSVVIRAHAAGSGGYEAGDKDITMTVTVGAQACNAPASLTIGTDGKITWPASTNCSGATYQIKIGNGSYETAISGVDKYDALTASTGTKTVCVKTIKPNNSYSNSSEKCATKEVYSVTLTKGTGISAVTGSGKNHIAGETVSIDATASTGYTWSKWTNTSGGSQVSTTKAYSGTISSNWAYTATATANTYTLNYSDNIFTARTQSTNDVVATYTANGSYLTLNGTLSTTSIADLWNLEKRTINSGNQYKITINYISGTLSCSDSSACTGSNGRPVFVLDLVTDGATFSDRNTSPVSYKTLNLPTSGSVEGTFTVDSSRASANGLKYWVWQKTAGNATFSNYKVQIIITKVHSKSTTYNSSYGTLDTPTKTGYTFNGWYTAISGGTKITDTSTYTTVGNQTLYAQWTPHKVSIEYNGNGSDVTWCSTNSSFAMDSNKFAINSDSTRYKQTISYGQYVSYTSGLNNYNNNTYFCYSRTGYSVPSGSEWVLSTNSSKKYGHNDLTVTAQGISSDAGCNLETTASCSVQVNVNWTANTYTITYNANGGSGAPSATTYTYASSGTVNLSSTKPTKTGYNFLGWSTSSTATSATYASGAAFNKSTASNTTLYAVWSGKPVQIYYHPNSGSVTASGYTTYSSRVSQNGTSYFYQTINSGGNSDPYNYTTFGITRTGYSVPDGTEWCTNNSGGGTCFDHDVKYTYDQYKAVATERDTYYEVLLYTHWTINKIYLRYNVNGGSWAGSTNTNLGVSNSFVTYNGNSTTVFAVDYNGTINLADWNNASYINISKTGYTAVSGKQWCTGTSGNGTCYNHSTDYANAGTDATSSTHFCDARTSSCTVTLYVNWTPNALTFNNQSISKSYSTSAQTFDVTAASNGTGTYTYAISSQPSGSYFTISGTKVTIKASTPAGSYSVVIKASDSNSKVTKDATYTVTIAKVNATCPTISDWTGSYDGSQHSINVSGGSGGSIQYRWNSTTEAWRDTKPTASIAGTWKVYVQMKGDSNHNTVDCGYKTLTINKIAAKVSCSNKTYTGGAQTGCSCDGGTITGTYSATSAGTYSNVNCTPDGNHTAPSANSSWTMNKKALTVTAKAQTINYGSAISTGTAQVTTDGLVSGDSLTAVTLKASTTNVTTAGTITPSAGTTSKGVGNYSVTYKTGTLIINKVAATCPTLTAYSGTYNGSGQTISVSGGSGGTIKYRTSTSESWTTTKPSRTTAGTTTVYVMMTGDSNHTDKDCGNKTITVNKATPSFLLTETSGSLYVDGTKTYGIYPSVNGRHDYASTNTNVVGIVKLTDDTTCSTANKQCIFQLTGKTEGQNIVINHVFTPSDTTNYNTVSATFTATVTSPPCYKLTCSCKVNGSWKTKNNMIVSSAASNFCSNTSVKESACNSICWGTYGGGSVQAVTVGNECSSSSCPAPSNASTQSGYPWARKISCTSPHTEWSTLSYFQTQSECTNSCSSANPNPPYCSCSCYKR